MKIFYSLMNGERTFSYRFNDIEYDLASRTHIMGVLNVTPDSFSDGGTLDPDDAVRRGLSLADDGADFLDVGGESTRPGSVPVPIDEELKRIVPVIERLAARVSVPISVDTYKPAVADRALSAGAVIINDITGFHFDPGMAEVAAKHGASVILMHIKGEPKTMQIGPSYKNLIEEICEYLSEGIRAAEENGIKQIIVDPGIGFGKSVDHNLQILKRLREFGRFGYPLMTGPSRKSFIGEILDVPVGQRLEGTAAAVAASVMNGANIVRVHDVKEMGRIARFIDALVRA